MGKIVLAVRKEEVHDLPSVINSIRDSFGVKLSQSVTRDDIDSKKMIEIIREGSLEMGVVVLNGDGSGEKTALYILNGTDEKEGYFGMKEIFRKAVDNYLERFPYKN